MGQHHGPGWKLISCRLNCDFGDRGSISVTGIVVFFALIFLLVIGTNWVDNDLALGAFRTVVSQAAQAGALQGVTGGPQDACYAAAARAQADIIAGPLAKDITVTCSLDQLPSGEQLLVATGAGDLPDWVVPVTEHVQVVAQALVQVTPSQPSSVGP